MHPLRALVLETTRRHIEADFVRLPDGEGVLCPIDGRSHVVRWRRRVTDWKWRCAHGHPDDAKHPLEKRLQASGAVRAASRGETVSAPMLEWSSLVSFAAIGCMLVGGGGGRGDEDAERAGGDP